MRRPHPLVHTEYQGLTSLVDPVLFEKCVRHASAGLEERFGLEIDLQPYRLRDAYSDFYEMIKNGQDEEITPDPPSLVDQYSAFCIILNRNDLVRKSRPRDAAVRSEANIIPFGTSQLRHSLSSLLAVSLTMALFQDEFLVDYKVCHIELREIMLLAQRMKRTLQTDIFASQVLEKCRYLQQHIY